MQSARKWVPQVSSAAVDDRGKPKPQPRSFFRCRNQTACFAPRFNPKYSTASHPKLSSEINAIIPCEIAQ